MLSARVRAPLEQRPLAREAVVVALLFGGFLLWVEALGPVGHAVASATDPLLTVDSDAWALVNNALVQGGVTVAGMVAFTAVYARTRHLSLSPTVPDRSDLPLLAVTALFPPVWVAVVSGLAGVTGTTLSALTDIYVAADASTVLVVVVTVLGLFVSLPAYVLLAHVLVQRTLRTATSPWTAVGLTTLLVGFTGPRELADPGLGPRAAAVSLLLAAAIALPAYAAHSFDRAWLPRVCAIPLVLFTAGFVVEWLTGLGSPAAAALALGDVAVVTVGGYAYERTGSLLAPALAYASFVAATRATILLFETGISP